MGRDFHATGRASPKAHNPAPIVDHERAIVDPGHWKPGLNFSMKPLNTEKVKRAKRLEDVLRVCTQHNLRSGNEAHRHRSPIDMARTHLNETLVGAATPDGVADEAWARFLVAPRRAKGKPRKDLIMGYEFVFQAPPGWDCPQFWGHCLRYVRGEGFDEVVHAVVHRDQAQPHIHVIALPITDDGRWAGGELFQGYRLGWEGRRAAFDAYMRRELGLRLDRDAPPPTEVVVGIAVVGHSSRPSRSAPHAPTSIPSDFILGASPERVAAARVDDDFGGALREAEDAIHRPRLNAAVAVAVVPLQPAMPLALAEAEPQEVAAEAPDESAGPSGARIDALMNLVRRSSAGKADAGSACNLMPARSPADKAPSGASARHGLRRTNADKHRAVRRMLDDPEWSLMSDREIAKHCVASHTFVANIRRAVKANSERLAPVECDAHGATATPTSASVNRAGRARSERLLEVLQCQINFPAFADAPAQPSD